MIISARPKTIMEKLKDTRLTLGDTAVFTTTVSHPEVHGRWLLNGKPIPKEDRYTEEIFMNKRKLIVPCIQPDDEGFLEFDYGTTTSKAKITVKGN